MDGGERRQHPPGPVRARGHAARGAIPRRRGRRGRGLRGRIPGTSPLAGPAHRDQGPEGPRRRRSPHQRAHPREIPCRGAAALHAVAGVASHRALARLRCGHHALGRVGAVHGARVARRSLARRRSRGTPAPWASRTFPRRGLRHPRARRGRACRSASAAGRPPGREAGQHLLAVAARARRAGPAGEGPRLRDREDHEGGRVRRDEGHVRVLHVALCRAGAARSAPRSHRAADGRLRAGAALHRDAHRSEAGRGARRHRHHEGGDGPRPPTDAAHARGQHPRRDRGGLPAGPRRRSERALRIRR